MYSRGLLINIPNDICVGSVGLHHKCVGLNRFCDEKLSLQFQALSCSFDSPITRKHLFKNYCKILKKCFHGTTNTCFFYDSQLFNYTQACMYDIYCMHRFLYEVHFRALQGSFFLLYSHKLVWGQTQV